MLGDAPSDYPSYEELVFGDNDAAKQRELHDPGDDEEQAKDAKAPQKRKKQHLLLHSRLDYIAADNRIAITGNSNVLLAPEILLDAVGLWIFFHPKIIEIFGH